MALLILGPMAAEARGSIGGTVFSRNRFGAIARQRIKPVNPGSARQTSVRTQMATLQGHWRDTLTQTQRSDWENYAASTPLTNRVGGESRLTGPNIYIRSNSILLRAGQARLDDAPNAFGGAAFPVLTFSGSTVTGLRILTISPALAAGDVLQVLTSGARPQSVNFFKSGFDLTQFFIGVVAPPYLLIASALLTAGHRYFSAVRLVKANGQVSQDFTFTTDIS